MSRPNMDYCKFENTLSALRQCDADMTEPENRDEKRARLELIALCAQIVEDYADELDNTA